VWNAQDGWMSRFSTRDCTIGFKNRAGVFLSVLGCLGIKCFGVSVGVCWFASDYLYAHQYAYYFRVCIYI